MTVTDVRKDPESLTMTITAEYTAAPDRVWQLWDDPRQLERWWGPPGYPATVVQHHLSPGGEVEYYMTGPGGERFGGWWEVHIVEAPTLLRFVDGFADADGNRNDEMPTTTTEVRIIAIAEGGTRMTIHATFPSQQAMERLLEMGMDEGMLAAMGQIDKLLAEHATT